jgi:hypothetical protein
MERGICDATTRRETSEQDLFRSWLEAGLAIDWGFLEQSFRTIYTDRPGQPPLPTRG